MWSFNRKEAISAVVSDGRQRPDKCNHARADDVWLTLWDSPGPATAAAPRGTQSGKERCKVKKLRPESHLLPHTVVMTFREPERKRRIFFLRACEALILTKALG